MSGISRVITGSLEERSEGDRVGWGEVPHGFILDLSNTELGMKS